MRNAVGTGATGSAKKPYAEPEILRFGTVAALTENSNLQNADVPLGNADTAHCDITNPNCGIGGIS